MTGADKLVIESHIRLMIMQARRMQTREDRLRFMTGQAFRGPHFVATKDEVVISESEAETIADLLDSEVKP